MLRKNYFSLVLVAALFLTGTIFVSAQAAPLRGRVDLKKDDGTFEPVAGAVIDVYRTDVKGKLPPNKTDKKGEFVFAGVPLGMYVVVVSAPNVKPEYYPNIKSGSENLKITVVAGDGKRWTEEEVRQALDAAPTTADSGKPAELSAEEKKKQAEQLAKFEAEKKKVDNINAVVNKAQAEGNKAFKEANYDLAITNYDEGINADPDFEGSAPVLNNNKAIALINRAILKYNAAMKGDPGAKATALEGVKKDLTESVSSSNKSLQILSKVNATDANLQKSFAVQKTTAYANLLDAYSRMLSMGVDTTKGKDAVTALGEYSTIETDAAKKTKTEIALADGLRNSGDSENAILIYRKAMETAPDNPDVLAGLGLSLFNSGVIGNDTVAKQEGLNYMQKFAEIAPETHPLKASVKDAVDYLKTQDKLTPQKVTKGAAKKKS